jgi:hypothetical protein
VIVKLSQTKGETLRDIRFSLLICKHTFYSNKAKILVKESAYMHLVPPTEHPDIASLGHSYTDAEQKKKKNSCHGDNSYSLFIFFRHSFKNPFPSYKLPGVVQPIPNPIFFCIGVVMMFDFLLFGEVATF